MNPHVDVATILITLLGLLHFVVGNEWNEHIDTSYAHPVAYKRLVEPRRKASPLNMLIQDTVHYQLNTAETAEEFASLLPAGGHVVYQADDDGLQVPHTVALFHQLRCLDIIRRDYIGRQGASPLGKHCMNYLRQSILCLSDTKLEPVRNPYGPHTVVFSSDYMCNDWNAVYSAANSSLSSNID